MSLHCKEATNSKYSLIQFYTQLTFFAGRSDQSKYMHFIHFGIWNMKHMARIQICALILVTVKYLQPKPSQYVYKLLVCTSN